MNPAYLDEEALRYELRIRDKEFESIRNAKREVHRCLREEVEHAEQRPQPGVDSTMETTEASSYFNLIEELTTFRAFHKEKAKQEEVYSRLCHLERRFSHIKYDEIRNDITRQLYDMLRQKMQVLRKKLYSERPLYVTERIQREAVEDDSNGTYFASEDEEKMKLLVEQLKELRVKRNKATRSKISHEQIVEELPEIKEESCGPDQQDQPSGREQITSSSSWAEQRAREG